MNKKDPAWILKTLFVMAVSCTVTGAILVGLVLWHFSHDLPKIITVADYKPLTISRVVGMPDPERSKDLPPEDTTIGEFYSKERRLVVPFEKIPEVVIRAFISAEDDKFFEHMGVNLTSMLRASIANFKAGHVVQGGSTITQQVAKSLLLTSERSFGRKIREVILASRIERNLSKQQILYLYLNQIYLGHGSYGVQEASRTYYRKDVSELSVAEAAVLAGMPQAPTLYSPIVNAKKAKERQLYVLRRMLENHFITQAQYSEAAAQPLKVHHYEDINTKVAPYLVEHIRRSMLDKYGEKALYEDGLTITVPTRAALAKAAGKSLKEGLLAVDKRGGYRGATQRLKNNDEIEKFLKDQRLKLIDRKLHHQVLTPDGRLDSFEAMRLAGLKSDVELLEPGEFYPAVVTSFDDKRKVTGLMVGAAKVEMPADKIKWAGKSAREIFAKGDVILVKLADESKDVKALKGPAIVQLEQEPQVQGALLSIEAHTGYVLAMEGGYDFGGSEFNRAIQAQRQPGSAFKPIIFSAALEKGFTPTSIIVDSPIVYDDAEAGKWKPSNYEEKFYGDTTFRQALIKSRNVPTIKIAQALSVPTILNYSKRLGIEGKLPGDLSISLGSASISLYEMTKAYALFPRLGRKVDPIFITKVMDRDGKVLEEQKPQLLPTAITLAEPAAAPSGVPAAANASKIVLPEYPLASDPVQVLDPRVAYVMTHLMNEVVNYGTGHDAKALQRAAAGKTGTTSDYIDAWFMGFTPQVVTGVWVGFDSQKTIGPSETGARAALPIWLGYMREAVKGYPDVEFTVPPGVAFASINEATGKLAPPNSTTAIKEVFIDGTQPGEAGSQEIATPESQSEFFKEDTE